MNLLVVEDEPAVAEFLSRALGREGYNVTAVHTGKEALTKAYEPDIDLILLDVLLPDVMRLKTRSAGCALVPMTI